MELPDIELINNNEIIYEDSIIEQFNITLFNSFIMNNKKYNIEQTVIKNNESLTIIFKLPDIKKEIKDIKIISEKEYSNNNALVIKIYSTNHIIDNKKNKHTEQTSVIKEEHLIIGDDLYIIFRN